MYLVNLDTLYPLRNAIRLHEYSEARGAVSRATELLAAPTPHYGISRHEVMNFFRNGSGTELLTRNYNGDGADWGDYVLNTSVNEVLRTRGDAALSVIEKEMKQMIAVSDLSVEEKHRIIRSSMFLKEKFLASGEFEKLKARLVAGGNQQDRDLYGDLSAPTVATSSVFTLLSIAAHENRMITVIDISGAFLNADMDTELAVHMRLDRNMSNIMTKLASHCSHFTDHKGCVVVNVYEALYECVESAALWYENLRASLSDLGYSPNAHDMCVFTKHDEYGVQCTIAVHIDDLMIQI